jgi:hypothetical protein
MIVLREPERREQRRAWLQDLGADRSVLDEVLSYTEPVMPPGEHAAASPAADEPHLAAWVEYARNARTDGAFAALAAHFVQLRFPIRDGISTTEAYRAATRRGLFDTADAFAPGLRLTAPSAVELVIAETIAGRVPVVIAPNRHDFTALVQAFTARNEPVDVPPSMGACLVSGLINWSRIAERRRRWLAAGNAPDETSWNAELDRLSRDKPAYQDRFILLVSGPYSGVSAEAAGMPLHDWPTLSLAIRLEHEATHYLTSRTFGFARTHLLDELLADFTGLLRVLHRYPAGLALLFLGLERFPHINPAGRLLNYRGALSEPAVQIVARLLVSAAERLEQAVPGWVGLDAAGLSTLVLALSAMSLEELSMLETKTGTASPAVAWSVP